MKQQCCNCLVVFSMFGFDGDLGGHVGRFTYRKTCWHNLLSDIALSKQVVVPTIASKAVIPSFEASKCSSGLLQDLQNFN